MSVPFAYLHAAEPVPDSGLAQDIFLSPAQVAQAARHLAAEGYYIEDVCGADLAEGYEVVYHFDVYGPSRRVALRVLVDHDDPKVPSIADIFQGAEWHERETTDFFGIVFEGNPNPKALLLPDDMDTHPLQKEPKKRAQAKAVFGAQHFFGEELAEAPAKAAPADEEGDEDAE